MITSARNLASPIATAAKIPAATTTTTSLVPNPVEVGISATKTVSTVTEVAEVVTPLVADRFTMNVCQSTDLTSQLTVYFDKASIMNEEVLSFMTSI